MLINSDTVRFNRNGHTPANYTLKQSTPTSASPDRFQGGHSHGKHTHASNNTFHAADSNGAAAPRTQVRSTGNYYDAAADKNAAASFYGDAARFSSESPTQLYTDLQKLVTSSHKPLPYGPDKYLYPQVDRHPDGNIFCVYSGGGPMFVGDNTNGNVSAIKDGNYNCEHVVPQSWFHKQATPRGDLHHLYAAQIDCNSERGNAVYADLSHDPNAFKFADGSLDKNTNQWEPKSGKGEVARSVLYFLIRYPGQIGDEKNEYTAKDIPMLQQWSRENPPTDYERHRNMTIQGMQGNRNPLIDFPQLVDKVDFAQGLGAYGRRARA